jgi:D-alanyl-D-alanine carboxypeptidase
MNTRWQTLILVALILISLTITNRLNKRSAETPTYQAGAVSQGSGPLSEGDPALSYESKSPTAPAAEKKVTVRKWGVADPPVQSEAVLIQALDGGMPLFYYNTQKTWPIASIAKLVTALVVLEEIGPNKKIPISKTAMAAFDGSNPGGLRSGEIYIARDLLKIMLLASSNEVAAAFEEYVGGRGYFIKLLNQKAASLLMSQTILHDAAGFDSANESSASDLLKLTKYIIEKQPDIFSWTRLPSLLVQPTNEPSSHMVVNINPLTADPNFIGGKTGTTPEARENLIAIFSVNNTRVAIIILGSPNRFAEVKVLTNWLKQAYDL